MLVSFATSHDFNLIRKVSFGYSESAFNRDEKVGTGSCLIPMTVKNPGQSEVGCLGSGNWHLWLLYLGTAKYVEVSVFLVSCNCSCIILRVLS